ncbi:MAG TPA: hypothetical protein PLH64_03380, partial [Anaerolineaceae bacterium]|nr:hypothetical protein [Anaerolineaceae bacterium]
FVILRNEGSYPFSSRFFAGAQNDNNKTKYFVILRNEGSYPFSSRFFADAQNDTLISVILRNEGSYTSAL